MNEVKTFRIKMPPTAQEVRNKKLADFYRVQGFKVDKRTKELCDEINKVHDAMLRDLNSAMGVPEKYLR